MCILTQIIKNIQKAFGYTFELETTQWRRGNLYSQNIKILPKYHEALQHIKKSQIHYDMVIKVISWLQLVKTILCAKVLSTYVFELDSYLVGRQKCPIIFGHNLEYLAIVWDLRQGNMQKIRKSPEVWSRLVQPP